MVLLTVVSTLAAGMVWQQWKSVQVEAAERARGQLGLMLASGLDYGRLVLRRAVRSRAQAPTALSDGWATPLEEARISSVLAMDKNSSAELDLPAYLSGQVTDAQARYNLRHLLSEGKLVPEQVAVLSRLCDSAGLAGDVAARLADRLLAAERGADGQAPLPPQSLEDLRWLDIDEATLTRLAPLVVLLPQPTPINLNTAPREVLAAVIPNLDLGSADRLVQARAAKPFESPEMAAAALGTAVQWPSGQVDVRSSYFEVTGRIRLEERVLTHRYIVQRLPNGEVRTLHRQRGAGFADSREGPR